MKISSYIQFLVPLVFIPQLAIAQPSITYYETLSVEDGLSQGYIHCIYQDSQGFMWFGTNDGLNKYNGYEFTVYKPDPLQPGTISHQQIYAVYEDSRGLMWIGTGNGINIFHKRSERFYRVFDTPKSPDFNEVRKFLEDSRGNIYIYTKDRSLYKATLSEQLIQKLTDTTGTSLLPPDLSYDEITHHQELPEMGITKTITAPYIDAKDNLWFGSGHVLYQYTLGEEDNDKAIRQFSLPVRDSSQLPVIGSLCGDHKGNTWVITTNGDLFSFNSDTEIFNRHIIHLPQGYNIRYISAILQDSRENLWVITDNGKAGLLERLLWRRIVFILSPDTKQQTHFQVSGPGLNMPYAMELRVIYEDRGGVIWLGGTGKGLIKYYPGSGYFKYYGKDMKYRYPGNRMSVYKLYEDRQANLWIETLNNLFHFNRKTGKLTPYNQQLGLNIPPDVQPQVFIDMIEDREGIFWIAYSNDLIAFHPETKKIKHYRHEENNPRSLRKDIRKLFTDRLGRLWVGSRKTINRMDRESAGFIHYTPDKSKPFGDINAIQDSGGFLWIGTPNGLFKLHPETGKFLQFKNDPADTLSLRNNYVKTVCEDPRFPERFLWVGTHGGGLGKFDKTTAVFTHYTQKQGLPNDVVYGVLSDEQGFLWLSTNKGLSRFDPLTETFFSYSHRDGLQGDEFNTDSYFKSPSGELFFGGIKGVTAFYPDRIQKNHHIPDVVITGLKITNKPVSFRSPDSPLKMPMTFTKDLELSYKDNMITFEFKALDYAVPEKNRYAYKLDDFNDDWIDAHNEQTATYTNIPPGSYTFRVKAANNDGVWNETGASVKLTITPPWWKTWWAYTLYIVFSLALLIGVALFWTGRVRLRAQLAMEHEDAKRIKALEALKSGFFSNITHEFRTPLTLVLGPVGEFLDADPSNKKYQDNQFWKDKFRMVKRNGLRLQNLINQLLDISKLESGSMKLAVSHGDIVAFLRNITQAFQNIAQHKKIELRFTTGIDRLETDFDHDKVEKIVYNLISNALKFTDEGGKVSVELSHQILSEENPETREFVNIIVKDTGVGIPENQLPRIFDRFYQTDQSLRRKAEGTGIGLALVKELVELHGGTIKVNSTEHKGTVFTVMLPVLANTIASEAAVSSGEVSESFIPVEMGYETISEPEDYGEPIDGNEDKHVVLIIEDNTDMLRFVSQTLEENYRVLEAKNGKEGVARALTHVPDLIVSDIMMPEMDGYEVCQRVKEDPATSHVPILLLTAKTALESKLQSWEIGADAYLSKPFSPKELKARLKNLLEQRKKLRSYYHKELLLSPDKVEATSPEERFLLKIKELMEEHIGNERFGADQMRKILAMSRTQFFRKFRALTGVSPTDYIRSFRLHRARQLLEQQAGNIADIAFAVGFGSTAYFTKRFKTEFGYTPKQVNKG